MPKWVGYTLLTVVLWGVWGVVCKAISADLNAWEMQVISLLGVAPVIGFLGWLTRRQRAPSDWRSTANSFGAGLLGCVGNLACFQAMAEGGKAAAVIPLTSLYPITTILLALVYLGERPNAVQTLGIGFSLAAIWLFNVANEAGMWNVWLIYSLVPIVCWGIGGFLQKLATLHISGERCAWAFLLGFMPMALLLLVEPIRWSGISPKSWALAIASGLLFALGNLTVILAYGSGGRAVIVTPAAGLYMLVSVPLAVLLLGEKIGQREGWGIAMAVLAVVALCRESPPSAMTAKIALLASLSTFWYAL